MSRLVFLVSTSNTQKKAKKMPEPKNKLFSNFCSNNFSNSDGREIIFLLVLSGDDKKILKLIVKCDQRGEWNNH